MPDELRDQLSERARAGNRSLNAEIIAILQDALSRVDAGPSQLDVEAMAELIANKVVDRIRQDGN